MSVERSRVKNVLVLLSGGQDSTTCLWWVKREVPDARIHCLNIGYGQRHAAEMDAAVAISRLAQVDTYDTVDLSDALRGAQSALTNKGIELRGSGGFADDEMPEGLPTSFVPGRNLVFLAVAAAWAARYRCEWVVTGVCQTDYSGYPDCRLAFLDAMDAAVRASMPTGLGMVSIVAPLLTATKAETVQLMADIAVHFAGPDVPPTLTPAWQALGMSVTCYQGQRPGCGACGACQLRAKGFREAGRQDPQGSVERLAPRGPQSTFEAGLEELAKRKPAPPPDRPELEYLVPSEVVPENRTIAVKSEGESVALRCPEGMTLIQAGTALQAYAAHWNLCAPTFDHLTLRVDPIQADGPHHGDRQEMARIDDQHTRPTVDLTIDDLEDCR